MTHLLTVVNRITITSLFLLSLLLFIRYQGVQAAILSLNGDNTKPLPAVITPPIKDNSCSTAEPITVVSYNVLYGSSFIESNIAGLLGDYTEKFEPWSARTTPIKAQIESYKSDLIGLQEIEGENDISRIASLNEYSVVTFKEADFEYGDAALLFKTRRFDLIDSGQFWLSPTPDVPLAFGFNRLSVLRYVNWALLNDKNSHFKFLFVNTHFDNATANKEPSATLFRERIALLAKNIPIIATGDFNTTANTERYDRLSGSYNSPPLLLNAYNLAGQPEVEKKLHPNKRIDHILAGGPCKVVANNWFVDHKARHNGKRLSDHDPIVSQLSFMRNSP